jgi:hypothetical protein
MERSMSGDKRHPWKEQSMNAIRTRLPSPAMLVACVALVVALGGVSYAAGVLPKNSVGTAQLKKAAVTAAKIKKDAVTEKKVKNGSLIATDFKAGQLPAGPQGPKGDPGPQGPKGDPGAPLGANSVGAGEVQDGSLGTAELAHSIPAVRVTGPGSGVIQNDTWTALNLNIERYDTAAMHSPQTPTSRLMAPVDGIYLVTAQVHWQSSFGRRVLSLRRNENTTVATTTDLLTVADDRAQEVTAQVRLNAGDFIEVGVVQTTGAPLSVLKDDEYSPEFAMTWLAPGP